MTLRGLLFLLVGMAGLLGAGAERDARAQDRGAPRFGPATPSDTIEAEASDAGRIWGLAPPPADRFAQRYGMAVDSAWATHLRRGLLRLPGCTASLVSGNGLALTSAACVRSHLEGEVEGAVVAGESDDERPVPGLHADRLVGTTDVTAEVRAARRDTSREAALTSVRQQLQAEAEPNRRVNVAEGVSGTYTAYTYRRYQDVRLAFLPARAVSEFGEIDAAMTYPRQALDVAVLRVYAADGEPLSSGHVFELSGQGVRPGDPIVSAGPAAATHRAESAAQLAVRRALVLPERRTRLEVWVRAMRAHLDSGEGTPQQRAALREAERILKQTRVRLEALQNEYVKTRLDRRDARLRRALRQRPELEAQFGGLLDSLATLQAAKRELETAYRAFGPTGDGAYRSSTYRRMLRAGGVGTSEEKGPAEDQLSPYPKPVEIALLTARLEAIERHLRPDTAAVRQLLGGLTPSERAAEIVSSATPGASEDGRSDVPAEGPVAEVAAVVQPRALSFREEWNRLVRAERRLTDRLAEARAAVRTAPVLPSGDAPRLTDGRVLGYPYNGTMAPSLTTFFGLYEQHHAFDGAEPWGLPERWRPPVNGLDRSVPLAFVASVDGAVSDRGAPVLTRSLTLVGVAVGPNVQGVAGTYLFLPERMRTVAVDVRGLREALRTVYGADALADELFGAASTSDRRR